MPSVFLDRSWHPALLGWLWGFLPGPRELALVALVVVVLYGRSERVRRGFARAVRPWRGGTPRPSTGVDRWFLAAAMVASAAVAAWVATRMSAYRAPGR